MRESRRSGYGRDANTLSQIGGRKSWWGSGGRHRNELTPALSWAGHVGHYLLDAKKRLKPEIKEIVRLLADRGVPVLRPRDPPGNLRPGRGVPEDRLRARSIIRSAPSST
jgi:hypothetical protein